MHKRWLSNRKTLHPTLLLAGALLPILLAPAAGLAADTESLPAASEQPRLSWETGAGKSHAIPALEIFAFEFLLNRYDRHYIRPNVFNTDLSSIKHNLTHSWVVDNDQFATNQFLHPYQGSVYHGLARSTGNDFWTSLGFTFGGSLLWEIAGETTPPSMNDQIASGIGGSFLGEPLFRMASLILEQGGGRPGFWRELTAAAISPTTGFNRLVFGERFDAVFPSRDPAYFARLQVGGSLTAHTEQGPSQVLRREELIANFSLAYGLPGKPNYGYTRPFDYFDFEFTASGANIFENVMSRGLLVGKEYAAGDAYRGVWGVYGSYDYISPQIFRVSSTAVSLGTTGQAWLSKAIALQGTALAGVGYGAAGTIHGAGERDYHYGVTPQGLLALRLILGNRASIDLTGRHYYVSRAASTESRGYENIARAEASFTWRVIDKHAITLKYVGSFRDAHYPDLGERHQHRGTVSLFYTFLGDTKFGAVDWRPEAVR